jgi:hypothetical protein
MNAAGYNYGLRKFLRWVNKNGTLQPDGSHCWEWTRCENLAGYGCLYYNGKLHLAHRWFYEQLIGPIPNGNMHLHHTCKNTLCVYPNHLELLTAAAHARKQVPYLRHYGVKL